MDLANESRASGVRAYYWLKWRRTKRRTATSGSVYCARTSSGENLGAMSCVLGRGVRALAYDAGMPVTELVEGEEEDSDRGSACSA